MAIPIILVTHGYAAVELLNTAYMLVGKQENIRALEFLPGENTEILRDKIQRTAEEMTAVVYEKDAKEKPVLVVVDVMNGSPWNATALLMRTSKDYYLISGANVPLILNLIMERDECSNIQSLFMSSINEAKESISYFDQESICQRS